MNLKDQMAADLDVFINTDDFGDSAILTHGGSSYLVNCIFDAAYKRVDKATGIEASEIRATCKSLDVEMARQGDVFQITGGESYYVKGVHPDGTGVTILILGVDA